VNEKAALEVAAGAAYAGARSLVTMKQVGLNVASDPLMSLAYIGIKGGMVVLAADDPGPISSQTEQDTRHFAQFAHLPVFDPSTPEEAYNLIAEAFLYSEKYNTPVIFRPTTQVCHACASIELSDQETVHPIDGFVKDSKWVIFPRLSYQNHLRIIENEEKMSLDFSHFKYNTITGEGEKGIAASGVSAVYVQEVLENTKDKAKLWKLTTAHPFPEQQALAFLKGLNEVLVVEELDPVIEDALLRICGKHNLSVKIRGRVSKDTNIAGSNDYEKVKKAIDGYFGRTTAQASCHLPQLPVRPPVLCAGCPHRASFYSVKKALQKLKLPAVFSGDIGCYTLGNAMPLNMVDTCLCMGADVTIAQGIQAVDPGTIAFSFIGDSTFFASGITGVVNAVYNKNDIILIVLDNSTTAMTGHQPHPGTGITMMDFYQKKKQGIREDVANIVSIEKILRGIGLNFVETVDPFDQGKAIETVKRAAKESGVRAIIFKAPCIALEKPLDAYLVDPSKCKSCRKCITEIGCPAISMKEGKAWIEPSLCNGCSLCAGICPFDAISKGGKS
ncbi:MAG: thiamine pyrophosphate-dependent enzyme, partial [Lachnospiraceae bacterium]|nr:thiamine pyrophosphate-dependent enzyme [Lachnospiraceae bacterium]